MATASDDLLRDLYAELSCGLCGNLFHDPHVVPICGHAFCFDCICGVLEGPGVTQSRCPLCHQPVWKRELSRNHKYANLVQLLLAFEATHKSRRGGGQASAAAVLLSQDGVRLQASREECQGGGAPGPGTLDGTKPYQDPTIRAEVAQPEKDSSSGNGDALKAWAVDILSATGLTNADEHALDELLHQTELRLEAIRKATCAVGLPKGPVSPRPAQYEEEQIAIGAAEANPGMDSIEAFDIPPTEPMDQDLPLLLSQKDGGRSQGTQGQAGRRHPDADGQDLDLIPDSQEGVAGGWMSLPYGGTRSLPDEAQPAPAPSYPQPASKGTAAEASCPQGEDLVGWRCEVWWAGDQTFYTGKITACRTAQTHQSDAGGETSYTCDIHYDDEDVDLGITVLEHRCARTGDGNVIQILRYTTADDAVAGAQCAVDLESLPSGSEVVLAASGVSPDTQMLLESLVQRIPGARMEDNVTAATTHLVTPMDSVSGLALQRSTKYLTALARGAWVVSTDWVRDSVKSGCWCPEAEYEIAGDKHTRGGPARARRRREAGEAPLLVGIPCHVNTDGCHRSVNTEALKLITRLAGATMVERCGCRFVPEVSSPSGPDAISSVQGQVHVLVCAPPSVHTAAGNELRPESAPSLESPSSAINVSFNWVIDSLSEGVLLPTSDYFLGSFRTSPD